MKDEKPFPRYFVGSQYLRFDARNKSVWVDNTWREVTEAEAKARIMKPDEPKQPLRWVENCNPDKPGIWAWQYNECNNITNISGIMCASDLAHAASKGVRWCYLGPIPEILPPVKKVTERLWLVCGGSCGHGCSAYYEHWIGYNEQPTDAGDWIRTDRTREREVEQ